MSTLFRRLSEPLFMKLPGIVIRFIWKKTLNNFLLKNAKFSFFIEKSISIWDWPPVMFLKRPTLRIFNKDLTVVWLIQGMIKRYSTVMTTVLRKVRLHLGCLFTQLLSGAKHEGGTLIIFGNFQCRQNIKNLPYFMYFRLNLERHI